MNAWLGRIGFVVAMGGLFWLLSPPLAALRTDGLQSAGECGAAIAEFLASAEYDALKWGAAIVGDRFAIQIVGRLPHRADDGEDPAQKRPQSPVGLADGAFQRPSPTAWRTTTSPTVSSLLARVRPPS